MAVAEHGCGRAALVPGQIWSCGLSPGAHLELLPRHWELQMNSWCDSGWGEAAHPARGCGNVGLAAPPALGVG